jgi:hypothetical protein
MAAELFHADGQTDIKTPIAASRSFVNASKETSGVENMPFSVATKQAVILATEKCAIQQPSHYEAGKKRHLHSSI